MNISWDNVDAHERYHRELLGKYAELLEWLVDDPDRHATLKGVLAGHIQALSESREERETQLEVILLHSSLNINPHSSRSTSKLSTMLRLYRQELTEVPGGCEIRELDSPFAEERRSLQRMITRLEEHFRTNGVNVPNQPVVQATPQKPVRDITAMWQAKKNAVLRLEQEREEELENSPPSMHNTIRRIYGKAIDAIMEDE
jgi:hypothetical protein